MTRLAILVRRNVKAGQPQKQAIPAGLTPDAVIVTEPRVIGVMLIVEKLLLHQHPVYQPEFVTRLVILVFPNAKAGQKQNPAIPVKSIIIVLLVIGPAVTGVGPIVPILRFLSLQGES